MSNDLSRRNLHRAAGASHWGAVTVIGQVDIRDAFVALFKSGLAEDRRTRWATDGRRP